MKKNLAIILLITALVIFCSSILVIAKNIETKEVISIKTDFKMEVYEDDKLTDNLMIVELSIVELDNGSFYVSWNEVWIDPVHEYKTVIIKPVHHSTVEGSIKNVTVTKDGFSFDIDLSGESFGKGRILQIVGKKQGSGMFGDIYDVKGSGLWWSNIIKESIKKDLRSTDKEITLPYKKIF